MVETEPLDPVDHPLGLQMYLADLKSGAVKQIVVPSGADLDDSRTALRFEPSSQLLFTFDTQVTGGHGTLVIGVFDQHGQRVATLPNPSTDIGGFLSLWLVP